jgi:hypothetical protein
VWFSVQSVPRIVVEVLGDPPTVAAHPRLGEYRFLDRTELQDFQVRTSISTAGPIDPDQVERDIGLLLTDRASRIDAREDRIVHQQLIVLAVVRRDVTYELAGRTSTIVVSGPPLAVAPGPAAAAAIRTRVRGTLVLTLMTVVGLMVLTSRLEGSTAYAQHTNAWLKVLCGVAALAALVSAASLTRLLRRGFRFRSTRTSDLIAFASFAVAVAAMPVAYAVGHPTVGEVRKAVAAHDFAGARLVLEALEKDAPSPALPDLRDEVDLASIDGLEQDAKLAKLDAISARNGAHSVEAKKLAHAFRRAIANRLLEEGKSDDAIATLEKWGNAVKGDAEFDELRAKAFEAKFGTCGDDLCRWACAHSAQQFAPSKIRMERLAGAKKGILDSLSFADHPNEPTLERLQRLRAVAMLADRAVATKGVDTDIADAAVAVAALARAKREKTAALGAEGSIVAELFDAAEQPAAKLGHAEFHGVNVSWILNDSGRCTGVYVVGPAKDKRVLNDKAHSEGAAAALSQAVGQRIALPAAPASASTVTYVSAGSAPVVARWRGSDLIELRIGDATP